IRSKVLRFATRARQAVVGHTFPTRRSSDLVKTVRRSHGQEGIYLRNGQRLRYKTRTKGGGRGFSADCVILDEAMVLPEAFIGARSEEHTSELQSRENLVCRLLLEKKK